MAEKMFNREQVVEIIGTLAKNFQPGAAGVQDEVQELKRAIDSMHAELSAAQPGQIQSQIPDATAELKAIVATTEQATHTIMSACETLQKQLNVLPTVQKNVLQEPLTQIMEACTFQDLTGQRISKITKALAAIDQHATQLSKILEQRFATLERAAPAPANDSLMNGPQLPGQGISQAEIDRLLNEF